MKFDGASGFIIDETDIGFDESPLSNDNGSDIFDGARTEFVVAGGGGGGGGGATGVNVDSDSAFLDVFVLIAGERLLSLSSSCTSFFN
jgi:hypothetical protein